MASRPGTTTETSPRPESTDTRTETTTNPDAGSNETAAGSPEAEGVNQESAWNGDSTNEIPDTDSRTTDSRETSTSETDEPSRNGSTSSDSAWNDPQSNEITDADRNATGVERTSTTPETGREHDTDSASSDTPNRSTEHADTDSSTPDTHHPSTESHTGDQPAPANEAAGPESQSRFDRGTTAREAPADQTVRARDDVPGADERVGHQTDGATDSRGEHPYRNAPDETTGDGAADNRGADTESGPETSDQPSHSSKHGDSATGQSEQHRTGAGSAQTEAGIRQSQDEGSVGDREQDGNPRQPEHPAQETAHADDANEQPSLEQQLASAHDKISDLQEQSAAKDQRIADLEARMARFEQSMGTQSDAGVQHAQDAEKDTTDGADTDAEQTGKTDGAERHEADVGDPQKSPDARNHSGNESDRPKQPDSLEQASAGPELEQPEHAVNQQPDTPGSGDNIEENPVGDRLNLDDRGEEKDGSKWSIHRGPTDRTLSLLQNAFVGGASAGAYELAMGQQHAVGWAAWGIGLAVSGIAWVRGRLKDKEKE